MIKNRVYFVHARAINEFGETQMNGGATIAWKVNDNGDLVIGQPTLVSVKDRYVRSIGRDYATDNLVNKTPLRVIEAAEIEIEARRIIESMATTQKVFSSGALVKVLSAFMAENDAPALLSTNWYEYIVRSVVTHSTKIDEVNYTI